MWQFILFFATATFYTPGAHALTRSRAVRRSRAAHACDWSADADGRRHNNVGVSLRARQNTTQVMLGVQVRHNYSYLK